MKYERYRGLASVRLPSGREEMSFVGYEGSRVSSSSSSSSSLRLPPRQSSIKRRDYDPPSPSMWANHFWGEGFTRLHRERERERERLTSNRKESKS